MAKGGRPRKYDPIADKISFAIEENHNKKAQKLITEAGVDILDGEARTPLMYTAFSNNIEMLKWLIDEGANIDHQDRNGYSSLHAAAQSKSVEAIEILLGKGANPNLTDSYGNGPLWTATMNSRGDKEIPSLFISAGADLNHKNNAGRSPKDAMELITNNLKKIAQEIENKA